MTDYWSVDNATDGIDARPDCISDLDGHVDDNNDGICDECGEELD